MNIIISSYVPVYVYKQHDVMPSLSEMRNLMSLTYSLLEACASVRHGRHLFSFL